MALPQEIFTTPNDPAQLPCQSVEDKLEALRMLIRCTDILLNRLRDQVCETTEAQHNDLYEQLQWLCSGIETWDTSWMEHHWGATAFRRFLGVRE